MKFTKMEGLGNDYIYVNTFEEVITEPGIIAKKLSDRHFGIGADGMICIAPSQIADCKMQMYNADGSIGEMCGNGIRCVGKYVYEKRLCRNNPLSVETLGGIKYLDLHIQNGQVEMVTVDMGKPELKSIQIPIRIEKNVCLNEEIMVGGKSYRMTGVSMGNPHAVVYLENMEMLASLPIERVGPLFENHNWFPNRINTEFVCVLDEHTVAMRVWERGSGETLACGTGACAVAVANVLNGYTDSQITVQLLGGNLEIEWNLKKNRVYMTGAAKMVFDGEIDL